MLVDLTPEHRRLRDELRAYFAEMVTPQVRADLGEGVAETPLYRQLVRQLGRDGWLGIGWPTEYGGRGGGPVEEYLFFEEAQRAGAPVPVITVTTVGPTLMRYGTQAQKDAYLPGILRGELHFAIGYTEPEAGTDLASMRTRAVRRGDEYVIDGQKVFTTAAHDADHIWLAVRTDPDAPRHQGISILIVPTSAPGFEAAPLPTMGRGRLNITFYRDVHVPVSALVGEENGGWQLMTTQLNHERVAVAAFGGKAFRALDETVAWARGTRLADGRAVIDQGWVQQLLARVHARLEAMKLLNWRVVGDIGRGRLTAAGAAAVKVYGTEVLIEVYGALLEVVGSRGALKGGSAGAVLHGELEREYRGVSVNTFGGGSNDVMREIVAAQGLGMPRARR